MAEGCSLTEEIAGEGEVDLPVIMLRLNDLSEDDDIIV